MRFRLALRNRTTALCWRRHGRGYCGRRRDLLCHTKGLRNTPDVALMVLADALDGLRQILQQMEAVGDLDGIRRPTRGAIGVCARAIPAGYLSTWVRQEPRR
jgi:hypothetical protein